MVGDRWWRRGERELSGGGDVISGHRPGFYLVKHNVYIKLTSCLKTLEHKQLDYDRCRIRMACCFLKIGMP
jgi:hypothetical protein